MPLHAVRLPAPTVKLRPSFTPLSSLIASALVLAELIDAAPRVLLVIGAPMVTATALHARLPRAIRFAITAFAGVVTLGAGLITRSPLLVAAGVLLLAISMREGWGINRGLRRRRVWTRRVSITLAGLSLGFFVVYPTLLAVTYTAKPRQSISDTALGLSHETIRFPASDGVSLVGWFVPSQNRAAVIVVHGGGGDREGAILHARALAGSDYGVLLYDARGRGESSGRANALGWGWDNDVRGAVDFLAKRGFTRIGLLGLSTGAEAVVTEAANDPRVDAVVADGLQGRRLSDTDRLSGGNRLSIAPVFAVLEAELRLVRGDRPPAPLAQLVQRVATTRPLLLIATSGFEGDWNRAYAAASKARLWVLPGVGHTRGLQARPNEYRARVLGLFGTGLQPPTDAALGEPSTEFVAGSAIRRPSADEQGAAGTISR